MEKEFEQKLLERFKELYYTDEMWARTSITFKEQVRRIIHEGLWPKLDDPKDIDFDDIRFFLAVSVLSCLQRWGEAINMDIDTLIDMFGETFGDLREMFGSKLMGYENK